MAMANVQTDIGDIITHVRDGDFAAIPAWQRAEMADLIEELADKVGEVEGLEQRISDLEEERDDLLKLLRKLQQTVRDMADDIRREVD